MHSTLTKNRRRKTKWMNNGTVMSAICHQLDVLFLRHWKLHAFRKTNKMCRENPKRIYCLHVFTNRNVYIRTLAILLVRQAKNKTKTEGKIIINDENHLYELHWLQCNNKIGATKCACSCSRCFGCCFSSRRIKAMNAWTRYEKYMIIGKCCVVFKMERHSAAIECARVPTLFLWVQWITSSNFHRPTDQRKKPKTDSMCTE